MAITSELSVTPEEVRQKAAKMNEEAMAAEADYKQLCALVSETASYWEGEAGTAFRQSMENLKPSVDAINKQLQTYSVRINDMMTQYENAEDESVGLSRSLSSDI